MNIFGKPANQRGLTALELISTLSVSLVVMTAGFPTVQQLSASSNMTSSINAIVAHLHMARSEAITRYGNAVLCPSSDGLMCLNDFTWHQGVLLFMDENDDEKYDAGEVIIKSHQPGTGPIRILTSVGRKYIKYESDGMASGTNATFTFCDSSGSMEPKKVVISNTGRVRVDHAGDPAKCP
jgi:type IV fimbrial biogenesis protein FimT